MVGARRLADGAGTATDAYSLDAFGRYMGGWGSTQNPYRFGAAWGYLTDTPGSGLLQLGARYYWPEIGRFIQQDPEGDGINWYVYVGNNPLAGLDPEGMWPWKKVGNKRIGVPVGDAAHGGPQGHVHWKEGGKPLRKVILRPRGGGRPCWLDTGKPLSNSQLKVLRRAGIVAGVAAGVDVARAYSADRASGCSNQGYPRTARAIGGAIGALGGAWAGAEAGAAIGAFLGPIGAGVGGLVGGIVGGLGGGAIGEDMAESLRDLWNSY